MEHTLEHVLEILIFIMKYILLNEREEYIKFVTGENMNKIVGVKEKFHEIKSNHLNLDLALKLLMDIISILREFAEDEGESILDDGLIKAFFALIRKDFESSEIDPLF